MELVKINEVKFSKIEAFTCSLYEKGLEYFKEEALTLHNKLERMTYVLITNTIDSDSYEIIGFFTYSFELAKMAKSTKIKLGLPMSKRYLSLYLNYFILDDKYKGKMINDKILYSTILMFHFFDLAIDMIELLPAPLITLHSLYEVELVYKRFDFVYLRNEGSTSYYAMRTNYIKQLISYNTKNIYFNELHNNIL